ADVARPRRRGDRMMKRREFITLVGGAAATWPLAARAQQPGKLPTIGYLGSGTPLTDSQWVAAFVQRMRELGWVDGRNFAIEVRWAEGRSERFAEIAAELVRLKVDVILTHNTPPVLAAKQATSVIPIVFASAGDPVGTGVVASLARPGGNVTGLSSQASDTAGKRNLTGVHAGLAIGLGKIGAVAHQAPNLHLLTQRKDRLQPVASSQGREAGRSAGDPAVESRAGH